MDLPQGTLGLVALSVKSEVVRDRLDGERIMPQAPDPVSQFLCPMARATAINLRFGLMSASRASDC